MKTMSRPDQPPGAPPELPPAASAAERVDFARGRAILEELIAALPPLHDDGAGSLPSEREERG